MSAIRRVYVASNFYTNVATCLRKALERAGFGNTISVEELKFQGPYCKIVFPEETLQKIPDIKFLLADPDIISMIFNHQESSLVWAQSALAGIEVFFHLLDKTRKTPTFIMTRHFESVGRQMAEYVLGRIIFRERRFGYIHDLQTARKYPYIDQSLNTFRTLDQLDIGVIGFGEIGQKVAQCCRHMGMTVWAALRDERYSNLKKSELQHTDHVRPMSRLGEMLEACDYVISILPSTPGTRHLLSGDVLKPCQKKKSVFINVGRGDVIDEASLANALKSGWLGGAILDVFYKEPLSLSSELWDIPGVTITPHCSATVLSGKTQPADSFIYNLKNYLEGKPMQSVVDFNKGY